MRTTERKIAGWVFCSAIAALFANTASAAPAALPWTNDLSGALKSAQKSHKLVLVDVYTSHCGWCQRLDQETFRNPGVIREIGGKYLFVKVNAEIERAKVKPYPINGYPTMLLLNGSGKLVGSYSGYMPPEEFVPAVENNFK
jgi:thioredoxin-related protein